jgi:hypothetical protein
MRSAVVKLHPKQHKLSNPDNWMSHRRTVMSYGYDPRNSTDASDIYWRVQRKSDTAAP